MIRDEHCDGQGRTAGERPESCASADEPQRYEGVTRWTSQAKRM